MCGDQLQRRALLAHALVRTTLQDVEWQDVDGSHLAPLHFNISHTSSIIACGVTVNSTIGIDVEEKQRKLKNDILAFARRYFSPYEVGLLTAISDPEFQRQEFIKLWTLKVSKVV
ncbi:4'-phosphopantetheinyl transferase [Quercus suber]|uniref:holo-[acyl-carrier-protein] synthase n=1 Tax=Quercus suber TaxID=58331 RepID=A0AAW0K2B3_QUESU